MPEHSPAFRRLAAIYFADVVGYSRLASEDEDRALSIVRFFQQTVRTTAAAHSGRIVKFLGDGALVEFVSTDAAAHAAYALMESYREATLAAGHRSALRVGLHLGEVVQEPDGDLYGDGVNLAYRLQSYALPGEVLISDPVWRQLRHRPEFRFRGRGTHRFAGGIGSERIFALSVGKGSHEDPGVGVREHARRIAARLRAPVSARLLVVLAVLTLLPLLLWPRLQAARFGPADDRVTTTAPSTPSRRDARAAALYTQGRRLWLRRSPESLEGALRYFGEAIAADPGYALAYAGLADVYSAMSSFDYGLMPPHEAYPRARRAVSNALALDSTLAEAHATQGSLYANYERDWIRAEQAYRKSLDVNPGYAAGYHWYAQFLSAMGRHEEALEHLLRASELDPDDPLIQSGLGRLYYFQRDYPRAIETFRSTLREDSTYFMASLGLGLAQVMSGDAPGGIAEYERAAALAGRPVPIVLALLGHAHGLAGHRDQAVRLLTELEEMERGGRYLAAELPAMVCLGLGDHDGAVKWLEKAFDSRSNGVVYLAVEPMADPLQGHPGFRRLVRRLAIGGE